MHLNKNIILKVMGAPVAFEPKADCGDGEPPMKPVPKPRKYDRMFTSSL